MSFEILYFGRNLETRLYFQCHLCF